MIRDTGWLALQGKGNAEVSIMLAGWVVKGKAKQTIIPSGWYKKAKQINVLCGMTNEVRVELSNG